MTSPFPMENYLHSRVSNALMITLLYHSSHLNKFAQKKSWTVLSMISFGRLRLESAQEHGSCHSENSACHVRVDDRRTNARTSLKSFHSLFFFFPLLLLPTVRHISWEWNGTRRRDNCCFVSRRNTTVAQRTALFRSGSGARCLNDRLLRQPCTGLVTIGLY